MWESRETYMPGDGDDRSEVEGNVGIFSSGVSLVSSLGLAANWLETSVNGAVRGRFKRLFMLEV